MRVKKRRVKRRVKLPASKTPFDWYLVMGGLTFLMLFCVGVSPPLHIIVTTWPDVPFVDRFFPPEKTWESDRIFASLEGVGVLAIGHAEGNLTVTGEKTDLYWGHTDPGNFKQNQGWCSDQGRGGGEPEKGDRKCLERVQNRLPTIHKDLEKESISAEKHLEVFINTVDLYNQASPWVSRQFPAKYRLAVEQGKMGEKALVWARVEAFRRRGKIDASGLIGICRRENRPVTDWDCVAADQRRRIRAIARVLEYHELSN